MQSNKNKPKTYINFVPELYAACAAGNRCSLLSARLTRGFKVTQAEYRRAIKKTVILRLQKRFLSILFL